MILDALTMTTQHNPFLSVRPRWARPRAALPHHWGHLLLTFLNDPILRAMRDRGAFEGQISGIIPRMAIGTNRLSQRTPSSMRSVVEAAL